VIWLTTSWPGGYPNGSAAVSTNRLYGDPRCTELPHRFKPSRRSELPSRYKPSRRSEPPRRSEPAASVSSPVSVVLGPRVVSESLDSRCSAQMVIVRARSITRPLTGNNCAVRAHCHELRRLNRCLAITAHGRHICALV